MGSMNPKVQLMFSAFWLGMAAYTFIKDMQLSRPVFVYLFAGIVFAVLAYIANRRIKGK